MTVGSTIGDEFGRDGDLETDSGVETDRSVGLDTTSDDGIDANCTEATVGFDTETVVAEVSTGDVETATAVSREVALSLDFKDDTALDAEGFSGDGDVDTDTEGIDEFDDGTDATFEAKFVVDVAEGFSGDGDE